jgi:beta-lactamase class C
MTLTKRRLLQAVGLALAPTLVGAAAAPLPPADPSADPPTDLGAAVADLLREYRIAGMAIAVTHHGRRSFYNFGVASKATQAAVTRDTLFEIGSISKTFTATLATYAQARGQLSLSASPARYLPELRGSALDKVSLVHLGTHTAGGFPLQVPEEITTGEQLMAYFRAWKPQFAPGTARTYANPSIGLLGMVTARAMGMPFQAAMEQQLFPRLGLHESHLTVPPAKMARYAQGYDKQDRPVRVNPGLLAAEAYGVKTTAQDLIRFVEANIDPSHADHDLREALQATRTGYYRLGAMTQDLVWEQYDAPVSLDALLQGNGAQVAYERNAVQAIVPPRPAASAVWVNKTGSTNGFGAYVAFVPDRQFGVVILANRNYPNEARVRLASSIFERVTRAAAAASTR